MAAAYVRLTDIIYPNGRDVSYGYGATGAVDDIMSRLATISESNGTVDAAYTYLGSGTIASENYEQPQIALDYSGSNFAALDRFGNVLNQFWASYGSASGNAGTLDGYTYTYDRAGNRTSSANATDAALSEMYGYDGLDRFVSMSRGTISNGAIADPTDTQTWTLDSLGNFIQSSDNTAIQTRTVNPANEIQTISGGTATPAYDLAGNMTTTPDPQPGAESPGLTCVYDAWNRLVQVSNGSTILAQYQYDGAGRRIGEFTDFTGSVAGTATYSYYSGQNAIETRTGPATSSPESLSVQYQYVFSAMGAKTPLLRDSTFDTYGNPTEAGRLYYLTDANTNVTAVVGLSGSTWQVEERYAYDPYGAVTMYDGTISTSGHWVDPHTSSSVGNTTLYASMILDPVTGLYYDEARWYSTAVSTFISRDPAQADENLYRYCGNEPVICVDPSGLWKIDRANGQTAVATSEKGDTIGTLASKIGLYVCKFPQWLTLPKWTSFVSPRMRASRGFVENYYLQLANAKLCPGQKFEIPNRIMCLWYGDVGGTGQASAFDPYVQGFKTLGFDVRYLLRP